MEPLRTPKMFVDSGREDGGVLNPTAKWYSRAGASFVMPFHLNFISIIIEADLVLSRRHENASRVAPSSGFRHPWSVNFTATLGLRVLRWESTEPTPPFIGQEPGKKEAFIELEPRYFARRKLRSRHRVKPSTLEQTPWLSGHVQTALVRRHLPPHLPLPQHPRRQPAAER